METKKTFLKAVIYRSMICLLLLVSGVFFSFKSFTNDKNYKKANHSSESSVAHNLLRWAVNQINSGDGYNFASADENKTTRVYKANIDTSGSATPNAALMSLTGLHDIAGSVATEDIPNNNISAQAVTMMPSSVKEESNALASVSSYVPAQMLASISESKAQELLNMASNLPASTVEKLKAHPELIYKSKNMQLLSGIIHNGN